jgi:Family of unknown function (DUF6328)
VSGGQGHLDASIAVARVSSQQGLSKPVVAASPLVQHAESEKDRTDRQLNELLSELRVVLPGAQVLLAFLFTVPFATRFGRVSRSDQAALFVSLLSTVAGTLLLMAPSIYHRVRWQQGGKQDVVRIAHRLFLLGTGLLAFGLGAAVFFISDFLYGATAAYLCAGGVAALVLLSWCLLPLLHGRAYRIRAEE